MARIASIKDLNKTEDDDKSKGQEFYAGGAGRNGGSGVSVVGPNSGNNNNKIDNIMKKAYWVNVTRGNKTIKRIIVQMKDGSKLYSLADWRSWNNNPHTILMRTLNEAK